MRQTPAGRRAARPGTGRPPAPELPPETMARRVARLSRAVRERRALEVLYGGAWRVVHPHAIGETGTGRLGLLTWQTAGVARGPGFPGEGWRMFDVARIEDAELLRATFSPRPREAETWTKGIGAPLAEVPPREAALMEPTRQRVPAQAVPDGAVSGGAAQDGAGPGYAAPAGVLPAGPFPDPFRPGA